MTAISGNGRNPADMWQAHLYRKYLDNFSDDPPLPPEQIAAGHNMVVDFEQTVDALSALEAKATAQLLAEHPNLPPEQVLCPSAVTDRMSELVLSWLRSALDEDAEEAYPARPT